MSTRLGGRYQLVRELGAGGMGRVFQAVDTESGRAVAAKVMLATSEDNLEALLRFQQEGAVLSTLKHPNIVEVYSTFLEEHTSAIIMELLEGRSLSQILKTEKLALPRIKQLVLQVVSALTYAHGRGIVHRDIKPDNIMVVGNDHVKVTDFGIARILRAGGTLNTATGTSIGTPLYMAPEQIEGQKVDGRADIYSLGTVMYQMVVGRPPFEGDDPLTIAFKHVHKAPQPPSEVNADVPSDWEAVILKALAKDPADRFQTAATLEEAVAVLGDGGAPHQASKTPTVVPKRPVDTVERILRPEVTPPAQTAKPVHDTPRPQPQTARPAASSPISVETPPPQPAVKSGPDGATIVRPGVDGADGRPTVMRPGQQAPALDPTVKRPGQQAPLDPTVMRPDGQGGVATAVKPQVVTPVEDKKRGLPLPVVLGGAVVVLLLIAAAAYVALSSPSPKKHVVQPQPTAPAISLTTSKPVGGGVFRSGDAVTLHWTAVPAAAVYGLQIATAPSDPTDAVVFKRAKTILVETNSYQTAVKGAQFYYWRVQANVNAKWGPFTPSVHFAVARPAIGRPVPLSPRNGTTVIAPSMRLCWSRVKRAVGYQVRLSGARIRSFRVQGTCTWVNVRPTTYHWSVAARVKGVRVYTGSFSAPASFSIHRKPKPTPRPKPTSAPAPVNPAPANPAPTTAPYVAPAPTAAPYVPPAAPAPTAVPYVPPAAPAPTAVPYVPPAAPAPTTPPASGLGKSCNAESC